MHRASESVVLSGGGYVARIDGLGATLLSLTRDWLDVVQPAPSTEWAARGFFGRLLAPWPNRVGDGSYAFEGLDHQLALTEPDRRTALHGLVNTVVWDVHATGNDGVELQYGLRPQPGYPFALDLAARFRVAGSGLTVTISATNVGDFAAPYGVGFHPYLTVGRRIDDCVLTLPATTRLETDARGLPIGSTPVARTPYDFRAGRLIADTQIDHCFGDLIKFLDQTRVALIDPDTGRSASVTVESPYHWLQVFTGDALGEGARDSVAVEPMTCPPDAFRSGIDLVALEPGEQHTATLTIA